MSAMWPVECELRLLDDAALAISDEVGEVSYVFACVAGGDGFANGGQGVGGVELRGEKSAVGSAEFLELLRGKATAFQAYLIEAVGVVVALDRREGVRQDVLSDRSASTDIGMAADAAELVDGAERADD